MFASIILFNDFHKAPSFRLHVRLLKGFSLTLKQFAARASRITVYDKTLFSWSLITYGHNHEADCSILIKWTKIHIKTFFEYTFEPQVLEQPRIGLKD